jgi:hypothetical protein
MSDMRRTVARWTTADIQPAESGGFVAYGDYLTIERQNAELLAALESMARQHCRTDRQTKRTDSGALSANAEALEILATADLFKIDIAAGRVVCGYWPEDMAMEKP